MRYDNLQLFVYKYLSTPSGCGKYMSARIFAKELHRDAMPQISQASTALTSSAAYFISPEANRSVSTEHKL